MSNKSSLLVRIKLQKRVDDLKIKIDCDHDWQEYGHGYKCTKCNYYTGLDQEINDIIKNE